MKLTWTGRTQEWLLDHGIQINEDGKLVIPMSKWLSLAYTGRSIRNPEVRTMCVPSDWGSTLLFENQHFYIVGG
jgi:hypothetical protein